MEWNRIKNAPRDGSIVELAWIVNGRIEWQEHARWKDKYWESQVSGCCIDATHWRLVNATD